MPDERVHDKYVAEAQFDSRDFDKNIRKSQKTLEDFKKSLNFEDTVSQMQGLSDSNSILTDMAKSVKKIATEMTGIGSVSAYVGQKIKAAWQGALHSVESFAKSLTTVQRAAGSEKYDKVLKSVQTIKNATGDSEEYVYQILGNLNKYTDETSYSFSEMASSISKFTTAGVGLADAEKELEGVANWAALAGQGINEANRAMYNISQAMSAGYMLKIDYKSIQNANMDIRRFRQEAINAAVEVGTLVKAGEGLYKTKKGGKKVTLDNFAETLSYKWFDRATMEKVFKTFGDNTQGIGEEAYKAAQRCVTLKDAIEAIKDMLSSGWMQSYEHVFGTLSEAMALFSGLCNKAEEALASFMEARNRILSGWKFYGGRDSLWSALVGEIESPDGEVLFKGAYGILDALNSVGDLIKDAFRNFYRSFINENNLAAFDRDEDYLFIDIGHKLADLSRRIQEFVQGTRDFFNKVPAGASESRFDQIRHVVEAIYATVLLVTMAIRGVGQYIGEVLAQLTPAFDALTGLMSYLAQLFTGRVVDAAKENTIGNFFHNLAEAMRPITSIVNIAVVALVRFIATVVGFVHSTGLVPTVLNGITWVIGGLGKAFSLLLNSGFFKDFTGWLSNLGTKIPGAVTMIKDFFKMIWDTVKKSENMKNIWTWLQNAFSKKSIDGIWGRIKADFGNLTKKIPELVSTVKGSVGSLWSEAAKMFEGFFGGILGFFTSSAKADEAADAVNDAIVAVITPGGGTSGGTSTSTAAKSIIDQIKDAFSKVWDPVKNFLSTFFGTTIPNFLKSEAVQKLGKFFEGTTFMGLLGGVTNLVKWLAIFRGGSGLVAAGKGIRKIGVGLKVFGKNLKNLNLQGMVKDVFNISNVIDSNNNIRKTDWGGFGSQVLKIAVGIGILAIAAMKLAEVPTEGLKQAGITLAAMLTGLIAADIVTKKWGGGGKGLLKIAAGVTLLTLSLKMLTSVPWGDLGSGFIGAGLKLIALMGSLAIASRIAGNVSLKGFVGFGIAVNLLLIPLKVLSKMPLFTGSGVFGGGLVQGFIYLAGIMVSLGAAAKLAGGGAKGMLSFALAITLLLVPIKVLSSMPTANLIQGVGVLEVIIASLAGLAYVAKGGKMTSFAGVVAAIAALAFIGTLVGQMRWDQALVGFGPIILMIAAMALLVKSATDIDKEKMKSLRGIFVAFAITVAAIAAAIIVMSVFDVKWETIATFLGGIVLILTTMSLLIKSARKIKGSGLGALGIVFGGIILTIVAIVAGLWVLQDKKVDWKMLAAMMGGITAIILAAGLFMPALSKMNPAGAAIAAAALFAAVVAIMGGVSLMAGVLLGSVGNALGSLSSRLDIAGSMFQRFFSTMSTISESSVQHAQTVFGMIKTLVQSFAGFTAYNSGIDSLLGQMNKLGTGLDLFFLNDSKYPSPESSKGFAALNKFIEIGPSLETFNIGELPNQIFDLGVALGLFDSITSGTTSDNPPVLGLMQGLFGQAGNIEAFSKLPLESLASQMASLGGAMSLYAKGATEVTGVSSEGTMDLEGAIGVLNGVMAAMNEEGGLSDFTIPKDLPGVDDLGLFGAQLAALAGALEKFVDACDGFNPNTEKAVAALGFIVELNSKLVSDNLKFASAFEDASINFTTLGAFALDIGALGYALSSFATSVNGKDFQPGLDALEKFEDINSKLTADNLDFVSVFDDAKIHDTQLGQFAKDIGELGHSLGSFAQNLILENGSEANFTNALQALNFMVALQNKLPQIGGLQEVINGHKKTLGELSGDINEMGTGLSKFSDALSGVGEGSSTFNYEAVMSGFDALKSLIELTNALNATRIDRYGNEEVFGYEYYVDYLTNMAVALNEASGLVYQSRNGKSFTQNIAEFTSSLSTAFKEAGGIDMESIKTFSSVAEGLQNLTSIDPSFNFTYPGEMIAEGIATGIKNGKSKIINAVVEVVNAGIEAGNETADIDSPSKVFAEMGRFMDLGLAKGLLDNTGSVEKAGSGLVDDTILNVKSLMDLITQAMQSESGLNPTITPVLDLSNVRNAGSLIGQYLNNGNGLDLGGTINLAAQAARTSGPTPVFVQNPTDLTGLYNSIAALQADILSLGTSIQNMKLVLNTGVVAGGLTDDIDQNLGRRSLYASRRN